MSFVHALTALMVAAVATPATHAIAPGEWSYVASGARGTLTTVPKDGATYVSARHFCFALGCRVLYQWANHRAVIQNPRTKASAVLSSVTHVALVDGKVVQFGDQIVSDFREGYLLPIDLAAKLATHLSLGSIAARGQVVQASGPARLTHLFRKIVVDPGHGGNDLGTGFGGIYEKDVAYFYASELRAQLQTAMPDVTVLITRDSDRYVSLPDRAKLANLAGADFFLSIHVNHAPSARVQGAETYILSPDATDNEAKKLALLENESWMKTAKISDAGETVKKILVDMEQTRYIQHSALAASLIQQELSRLDAKTGLRNRGVKQAMFYVLSQVAMPSALLEIGFLSSVGDRSRLMDVVFRDEFVKSIVNAIKKYRERTGGESS